MANLSRAQREELKALSKEVFGVSSKYQRFLQGVSEVITKEVVEEIPGEDGKESTTKTTHVPQLFNGVKQTRIKRYTYEEVKELLLKFKAQRDEMIAKHKKALQEQKEKQALAALQNKVQQELSGSSV